MWKKWTEEDDEYMRAHWELPNDIIARYLERSSYAIRERRRALGIPPETWEGIKVPEAMSNAEKEMRIIKMAADMKVRLLG